MSRIGCWKCGSPAHHRRDCPYENIDEGSAALTKRAAYQDQQHYKSTKAADKQKLLAKLEIEKSQPPTQKLLKKHVGICLEWLETAVRDFDEMKSPSFQDVNKDANAARDRKENLRKQFAIMREIVSHAQNYFHKLREEDPMYLITREFSDLEDEYLKLDVEFLKEQREPLFHKYSKLVADLQEVKRLLPILHDKKSILLQAFEGISHSLGERSPTFMDLESSQQILSDMKPILEECVSLGKNIKRVYNNFDDSEIKTLDEQFNSLCTLRKEKAETVIRNLKEQGKCKICYNLPNQCVIVCGHQMCLTCYNCIPVRYGLKSCPFCRRGVNQYTRLYFN